MGGDSYVPIMCGTCHFPRRIECRTMAAKVARITVSFFAIFLKELPNGMQYNKLDLRIPHCFVRNRALELDCIDSKHIVFLNEAMNCVLITI